MEVRYCGFMGSTARKKTTVSIDAELLRATKVYAARSGKREYQLFEAALEKYLGLETLHKVWQRSELSAEQAEKLAYTELRKSRQG